ncbi:NADH-dependent flavin oxidoreductase [Shewanella algae]|uniref:NADH-dependent flavin oxidoreductase n=1 Tax=Shewanella algae TaxID=38313 RepID=UPI0011858E40|nr:NADH-dependent flavin oxidoreductase [Shewanella algae]TVP01342.1 NADH:flavin oxidoreductase [Shewanella algae]BCV40835.1 NADH-dependent flavin oxidoreductase [Shewanella algae]
MTEKYLDACLQPLTFTNGITLRNRIVMAPMTTWSANPDGTVSDQELAYYRHRTNGVGMVITGCTHVMANGIGFTDEFAAHDDSFIPSLRSLAQAAKSGGAPAILQIFHAGNKAIPGLVPDGKIVSASALKTPGGSFNKGEVVSQALTQEEILQVIHAFGETTRRAIEAGFDGVELHGAHGFLIQNFFSPLYNQRTDDWGGSLENRMRFPLALVAEVRRVIDTHAKQPFLLGYRISPEESVEAGLRIADSLMLIDHLIDHEVDYIHASLMDILNSRPIDAITDQLTAEVITRHVADRVPVIAAGKVRVPSEAEEALSLGLSFVAVGKGLVMNPQWVELAQHQRVSEIDTELSSSKVSEIVIPDKLWGVIDASRGNGWFPLREEDSVSTT